VSTVTTTVCSGLERDRDAPLPGNSLETVGPAVHTGSMPKLVASPVFVGRADELTRLEEALRSAGDGNGTAVVVGGEAGVGKTRLIEELIARAGAEGAHVLLGGCVELGGDGLPLAPVVEALRGLARRVGPAELTRLVSGRRAELVRLLPELAGQEAGRDGGRLVAVDPRLTALAPHLVTVDTRLVTGDGRPGAADVRAIAVDGAARTVAGDPAEHAPGIGRLFDLVLGLLETLSTDRPVLFVVEDLHWADHSTLALVSFLMRNLRGSRVTLVTTYRSDELRRGHPLRPFLAEAERLRWVDRFELPRFGPAEVAELIGAILGTPPSAELVERILRRSDGNAFFVEELVCAVRAGTLDSLSPTLRDVLLARIEALPEGTQNLLRLAAAGGQRVGHRLLAAVAGLPDGQVWAGLRDAVTANVLLVAAEDTAYTFRHALVREALHSEALPGEQVYLHRRYAEAVEADPGLVGGGARAAAAVAYHWYSAHDLPRALPALVSAARQTAASYAYAEALQHLERALEIWDQVPDAAEHAGVDHLGALELAVDAARTAGEWHRALRLVTTARAEAEQVGDPLRLALLLASHAFLLRSLALADGITELEEAVRLVPEDPPTAVRARLLNELAMALGTADRLGDSRRVTEQALTVARRVGARREEAFALLASYCWSPDVWSDPEPMYRARAIASEVCDDEIILMSYVTESDRWLSACRFDKAVAAGWEGIRAARRVGQERNKGAIIAGNAIEALLKAGRWDEAEALLAETRELAPVGVRALFLEMLRAELALARGQRDVAEAALANARDLRAHRFIDAQYTLPLTRLEAEAASWWGDPAAVPEQVITKIESVFLDDVARYAAPLLATGMTAAAGAAVRARARRANSDLERALAQAARLAELAAGLPTGQSADSGAWLTVLDAELTRATGQPDPAAWSAAADAWSELGFPYPRACALLRRAEAHLAAGERDAADASLRTAADLADGLGARLLRQELTALAQRGRLTLDPGRTANGAGTDGDDDADSAGETRPLGLTARELDVLRLVAAGNTNPQIAAALFISAKTASTHVSNILGKLGVTSRGEAAAVAHHLRLFHDTNVA
jgi:DNA-binding CsgD family transcriptional regulator